MRETEDRTREAGPGDGFPDRLPIWGFNNDHWLSFFVVYGILYTVGSGVVIWLEVAYSPNVRDAVAGIMTGMSLLGVGVVPSLSVLIVEGRSAIMIFTRNLKRRFDRYEESLEKRKARLEKQAAENARVKDENARVKDENARREEHISEYVRRFNAAVARGETPPLAPWESENGAPK